MYILLLLILSTGCHDNKRVENFQKNDDAIVSLKKEKLSFDGEAEAKCSKLKLKETEYGKTKLLYKKVNREAGRSGDNRVYAQAVKIEKEIKKLKNIISLKSDWAFLFVFRVYLVP